MFRTFKKLFVNPLTVVKDIKYLIITKGWKVGIVAVSWECVEHFIVPGIIAFFGLHKVAVVMATLPVGELVFYPLTLKLWK